ncbi:MULTISPECIES: MFS transporter [Streptomyces]|uniref:MFS transporter n=1 Tax=Streptomyces TaxID=1883 RepID=UPI0006FFF9EA|nr:MULTISPECIES: MFS transporter [Streptomyces]KQX77698.1 MFS transporter [Streptomyces sp. Root1319]KQZ10399.1 MFS transporter [Streptomyces sp. Root55]RPK78234.1 enterobactin exporter EntS [Streptomyces sp. ADI97-07]WRY82906.1 MFS transporter [Streptomyces clavifer]WUC28666.1 MFS transporter [Streptomyces clavifer]
MTDRKPGDICAESNGCRSDSLIRLSEFRTLWAALAQSVLGDQLARVALSLLVFERTESAGWTAATYALTSLPALLSGVLLTGLADRFPRRTVMIGCDLVRAVLVGLMALPGTPLPLLAGLLVLAQLAEAPFGASQGALMPAVLGERLYERGQRVIMITHQSGQLVGFAVGGVLVVWLGSHVSLGLNAVTFLISAVLIRVGVKARPVDAGADARPKRMHTQVRSAAALIWSDPRLRSLVALGWLAGFIVLPEGLAAPFAEEAGASAASVGLLLAAHPTGMVLGAALLGRASVGDERRRQLLGPLAVGANLPLLVYWAGPGVGVALLVLLVSGICSAYQITAGATFVLLTPADQRGQALGLARSGLTAMQGIGVAAGGLAAQLSGSSALTIGGAGLVGTLCAIMVAVSWARARQTGAGTIPLRA